MKGARNIQGRIFLAVVVVATLLAPRAWATTITRVVSPGGIEAWLVRDATIPMLSFRLHFRGGGALDPEGKEGLANFVSGLLDEGAGGLDAQEFRKRLEDSSIRLSFDAGMDSFTGTVQTLTAHRAEAFRYLALALTRPRFDAAPVERVRGQILAGIARRAEDPGRLAGEAWYEATFPGHAYARPTRGTAESVKAITVADMRRFAATRLARDKLTVGVAGDITAAELATLLDATFGALPATAGGGEVADVEARATGRTIVIRKAIPQSIVSFGHGGIRRDDPDYYAAYVMNYILGGGGFSSRLTEEIREKRGLAYSAYSYLGDFDHATIFRGGVATRNDRVAESIRLVRAELARMRDQGVSARELADAKTYLTGSFPLRLDSVRRIAGMLVAIQLRGLGIDYLDRRNGYIEAVSLEDVRRVARRVLKPEGLTVVVVGDPVGVESSSE